MPGEVRSEVTPLEAEQQPMVALARRVHRLLINQHGVNDAAHLDQLLPVPAVAAKRDTSRAATAPTLPRQTSATMRSKPARAIHLVWCLVWQIARRLSAMER